jgi:hypothetical protein
MENAQTNHKIKNKEFSNKLGGLIGNIPEGQRQSMLEFIYYLISANTNASKLQ